MFNAAIALCLSLAGAPQPADPQLIPEGRKLLSYFHSIYGKQVIYGQATNHGLGIGEYPNVMATEKVSGKFPALVSLDLFGWNPPHWGDNYRAVLAAYVDGAKRWWQDRHGIVTMQYHWGDPLLPNGTPWVDNPKGTPRVDVGKLVTPGTDDNKAAMEDLRRTADAMEPLVTAHVPILFRPLHEIDGGWFWWTDRAHPENTAALYRMMYTYFVKTRGFHNLIWIWNVGDQKDPLEYRARFYPGSQYVDIAGVDVYSQQVGQDFHTSAYPDYYEMMTKLAPGKMIALCECDAVPSPDAMRAGPKWLYCLPWWAPGKDNPEDWVKKVANDPLMITLDKLPKL